ncbi:hypothetical protein ACU63S_00160 [Klebsiella aerogenes]|nr:hypothetical protein [Klebsiella aerogenes]HBW0089074.1 hypothetical protein [Klebsiella aerogenes]HBW0092130.1 hypothetical protein [Klebsiella aerogenes]
MPPVVPPAPVMTCFVGWRLTPYPTYAGYSNVQFGSRIRRNAPPGNNRG